MSDNPVFHDFKTNRLVTVFVMSAVGVMEYESLASYNPANRDEEGPNGDRFVRVGSSISFAGGDNMMTVREPREEVESAIHEAQVKIQTSLDRK